LEKNLDSFRNVTVALNPEVFEETPTNNWVAVLKCARKLFRHSFSWSLCAGKLGQKWHVFSL